MAASNRDDLLKISEDKDSVSTLPVPEGLQALVTAAGITSTTNLVITRENSPANSGLPSAEDIAGARTQFAAIDAILDAVNNSEPRVTPEVKKVVPVFHSETPPRHTLTEPVDNTLPVRTQEVVIEINPDKQTIEDLDKKSTRLQNSAGFLLLSVAFIGVLLELARSVSNKALKTRPNEKTTLNQIFDFGLPGFFILGFIAVYALLVASARADLKGSLESARFFKKNESDAKGKKRIEDPIVEEKPEPIKRR